MPRRRGAENREVAGGSGVQFDAGREVHLFDDVGRQESTAQKIFYASMKKLEERGGGEEPIKLFKKAVENAKPLLEVKTRRVGGANYQVPIEVPTNRRTSLAIRWILIERARPGGKRHGRQAGQRAERSGQSAGRAIKKRDDVHRMAEANKAFAHYRW
jgi:small subunit ribosomal protein S7